MNSRERVLLAINRQEPDRVPLDYSGEPEVSEALQAHFGLHSHEELLRYLHVDLRQVGLHFRDAYRPLHTDDLLDIWGTRRTPRTQHSGYIWYHPLAHLETQKDLDDYPWPDPAALDYEAYPFELDAVGDYARVGGGGNRILWTGIEMGLDILDPIQVQAVGMAPAELKRDFGDRLAFHGAIDVQYTLPFGTREEVHAEVLERMQTLGKGGGFILNNSHSLLPEFPLENIITMYETAYSAGQYPQRGTLVR